MKRRPSLGWVVFALFGLLGVSKALGADPVFAFRHSTFDPELARQFPEHPKRHVYEPNVNTGHYVDIGIKQIGVEHTACFGKCPIFTLIVNRDGTFRYHGEQFVKRRGDWHGTVELGELVPIFAYISEMRYFALADEYTIAFSDLPGTFTLVKTGTRKKVIYNYGGCGPTKLGALEYMIDHLLGNAKWKRGQS